MEQAVLDFFAEAPVRYERDSFDSYCAKAKVSCPGKVIAIAGTNGKSTTAKLLEQIYEKAGFHVACFLYPDLEGIGSGIRFDDAPISEEEFCAIFHKNEKLFRKFGLSAYEMEVAIAFQYFEEKKPQITILEAALGGELDATNLEDEDTALGIITSVSLDHTAELGTTGSEIAIAMAGVLKEGTPLVLGAADENSVDALTNFCRTNRSKMIRPDPLLLPHLVGTDFVFDYGAYRELALRAKTSYSLLDATLAIEAIKALQDLFPVKEDALREGLLCPALPCHGEVQGDLILDGASNVEAMGALVRVLPTLSQRKPIHALFASRRGSNIAVMLPTLANAVASVNLTSFSAKDSRDEMDYFLFEADYPYFPDFKTGIEQLRASYPGEKILVVGDLEYCLEVSRSL